MPHSKRFKITIPPHLHRQKKLPLVLISFENFVYFLQIITVLDPHFKLEYASIHKWEKVHQRSLKEKIEKEFQKKSGQTSSSSQIIILQNDYNLYSQFMKS